MIEDLSILAASIKKTKSYPVIRRTSAILLFVQELSKRELVQKNEYLLKLLKNKNNWNRDLFEALCANPEPKNALALLDVIETITQSKEYADNCELVLAYLGMFPDWKTKQMLKKLSVEGLAHNVIISEILSKSNWADENINSSIIYSDPAEECFMDESINLLQTRPNNTDIIVLSETNKFQIWSSEKLCKLKEIQINTDERIQGWCLSTDGNKFLFASTTDQPCILLDILSNVFTSIAHPSVASKRDCIDFRYCWDDKGLWFRGHFSPILVKLEDEFGVPSFKSQVLSITRESQPDWFSAVIRMDMYNSQVLKVDANLGQMLVFSVKNKQLEVHNWKSKTKWSITIGHYVDKVAFDGALMYVMYADRVCAVNKQGIVEKVYLIPKGHYAQDLDIVRAKNWLIVGCNSIEQNTSLMVRYNLDEKN